MSKFKTQKLSQPQKTIKTSQEIVDSIQSKQGSGKIKKWIMGMLIVLASILFVGNFALRAVGNMSFGSLGGESNVFTPTIAIGTGVVEKIQGTKNILIAGIGGQGHDGSLLTDSIMLASINNDDGYVTLVSIPRDLFVAYPKGYGIAGKINALYSIGVSNKVGIKLLAEKVSEVTGQGIDGYLVIDFAGFKSVIDALGGVDINVPKDLIDREYPNNNWGYETFIVRAGIQTFDGNTALKYARSRHSTSDFDRSARQQLILKGIKEKAISIGFLSSPEKIKNLFTAITTHIDTSLTIGDISKLALGLKDIASDHINIYTLNNDCTGTKCAAGAYLYTPSRDYFGGASVVIPENASATKLSYYEDIHRFAGFIFRYPEIRKEEYPITIVSGKGKYNQAKLIFSTLEKIGIKFDTKKNILEHTGSIATSHINVYLNKEVGIGIEENSTIIQALQFIEEKIPYSFVIRNEYITSDGPRIEIVIGNDIGSYFSFAKPAYYLPYIAPQGAAIGSGISSTTDSMVSGEFKNNQTIQNKKNIPKPQSSTDTTNIEKPTSTKTENPGNFEVMPGEWEDF